MTMVVKTPATSGELSTHARGVARYLIVFLAIGSGAACLAAAQREIGLRAPAKEDKGTETVRDDPRLHQVDYKIDALPSRQGGSHTPKWHEIGEFFGLNAYMEATVAEKFNLRDDTQARPIIENCRNNNAGCPVAGDILTLRLQGSRDR